MAVAEERDVADSTAEDADGSGVADRPRGISGKEWVVRSVPAKITDRLAVSAGRSWQRR